MSGGAQGKPKELPDSLQNRRVLLYRKQPPIFGERVREALTGDLVPKWVEVWALVNLGKIFDVTGQRERALNEYRLALRTGDNTRGALDEAAKYTKNPYKRGE